MARRTTGSKSKALADNSANLHGIPDLALALIRSASNAFYIVQRGNFVYVSPLYQKMTGYSQKEITGVYSLEHVHPDDKEFVRNMAVKSLKGKNTKPYEYRFIRKDGKVLWVLEMVSSTMYQGERAAVGSFMDITERKQTEKIIEANEIRLRELFQNMSSGVAIYEATADGEDFIFRDFNRAAERIDNRRKEDVVGQSILQAFSGVREFGLFDVLQRVWRSGNPEHFPAAQYHDEKITGWRENYVYKLPSGEIVAVYDDITERKKMEETIRTSEERYRLITDNMTDYVWLMDMNLQMQYVSPSTEKVRGFTFDELRAMPLDKHMTPASLAKVSEIMAQVLIPQRLENKDDKITVKYECEYYRKDGSTFVSDVSASVVRDNTGNPIGIAGIGRDITERKQMEQQLAFMATHDSLTGLPNRMLLTDRLTLSVAHAKRNGHKLAVMILDLDYFKDVNDTLGHEIGDQLLKATSDKLTALLRKSDTVARLGGDEFVILLSEVAQVEYAATVARKILDDFHQPFLLGGHELRVTTSIGIAVYPNNGEENDVLLKHADVAMYCAKERGRDNCQFFSDI